MTIDVKEIVVLGVKKPMDTAPIIQDSRTFVPLRFVSEGFGAKVEWEAATRTVRIDDTGGDSYAIGEFTITIEDGDYVDTSSDGNLIVAKKSGLVIYEHSSAFGNPETLVIDIKMDDPTLDIPTQRREAETLLRQKIDVQLVDEIMSYAATKKDRLDEIPRRVFVNDVYETHVFGPLGFIRITVYHQV
jgi:hypothetical protein